MMPVTKNAAAVRLEGLLSRPDGEWTLSEVALVVSSLVRSPGESGDPAVDEQALSQLKSMARRAKRELGDAEHPRFVAGSMSRTLIDIYGLRCATGKTAPEHYEIGAALESGASAPELFAIFLIEVSRMCRVRFDAIGLPGRLLLSRSRGESTHLFDPCGRLAAVGSAEFERLVAESSGGRHRFSERFLRPITSEQLVARYVGALKACFWRLNRFEQALGSVQMMLAIRPDDPREIRDQGRLLFLLGRNDEAIHVLELYLSHNPGGEDAEAVRMLIREARSGRVPEAERA